MMRGVGRREVRIGCRRVAGREVDESGRMYRGQKRGREKIGKAEKRKKKKRSRRRRRRKRRNDEEEKKELGLGSG